MKSRWAVRLGVALTLGTALLAGASPPASAHSALVGSNPAANATLTTAPTVLTLSFNEPIRGSLSTVRLTGPDGPDGTNYTTGDARSVDSDLEQGIKPLRSGSYHVVWRVISADGHPIQGEFRFTLDVGNNAEPDTTTQDAVPPNAEASEIAAPPASDGGSSATGPLLAVSAFVVIGLAGAVVFRARLRGSRSAE